MAQLFFIKMFLIDLLSCYLFTSFVSGTHGTKLQSFGKNSNMTERKQKSFHCLDFKDSIESLSYFLVWLHSCFFSGVPERDCGVLRNS